MTQSVESDSLVPDFSGYVAARGPALLRLAYLLTGNTADAQDVVQEALARALPRWDRIARSNDIDAYVRRMVVNSHVSWWRRFGKREFPAAEVRMTGTVPDVADLVTERSETGRLWRACDQLPRDQRVAVVLRYAEGLDYAAIASLTECAEATARSRVHRGLARLRATLGTT